MATVAVPAGIAALVVDGWTGTAVVTGTAMVLAGAMAGGVAAARASIPVLVAGAALGSATTSTWWWVVLVTALAVLAGMAAARRAMPAFAMATVAAVMAPPATSVRGVGAWAVGIGLGGLYGLALARRLHPTPSLDDLPVPTAVAAVGLGAGVAAAAALAVVLGDPRAVWIPLTVLVVGGTVARGQGRRTRDRALGTIAGVAIALVVVALQPPAWLPVILGVAALVGALAAAASSYRLQVLFITLAVVLTAGSPDTIAAAATSRLAYTLAGGAILMVGLVVARRFVPRLPRPDDEDTDPAVRRT